MANELSDAELLHRYLAGDGESAFATLVERHLPMVYGAALRLLKDPALAQEVAQNVFITLARRAVWLAGHPSLAGWLYRTAVHLAKHQSRAEQRRRRREQIAVELGTTMKPDDSLLSRIAPVLDDAFLELGAADREALLLRYFGNKSLREVGAALGVREDAAQKRVAKALGALTDRLRRRGYHIAGVAATALALEQASTAAVPTGLALAATKAALGAGAAASLGSLTVPLTKIMTLTKLQTAALCLTLAALPLGYQWHALSRTRAAQEQMQQHLQSVEQDTRAREGAQTRAERRVAELEDRLSQPWSPSPAASKPAAQVAQNLYLWDENSPYVRVPRALLSRVRFAPFATRVARDGKAEGYQLPPLSGDGTPQPALEAALGLSADEAERLRQLCQTTFAEYFALAGAHSQLNSEALGPNTTMKLDTAAFPEEGAQLRDQFRQQLTDLLGAERADAFWQQAAPVFSGLLNDFGAYRRQLQLVRNQAAGTLELFNTYRGGSSVGQLDLQLNGLALPPALQSFADTWRRELAAQSPPPTQQ